MGLGSGIRDLGSGIQKKPIPDPGSRGQKGTGSRIRIRNTASLSKDLKKIFIEKVFVAEETRYRICLFYIFIYLYPTVLNIPNELDAKLFTPLKNYHVNHVLEIYFLYVKRKIQ
jgi:hypothetical protein